MSTKTAKKSALRPLEDRVVLRPDVAEERTASGILLPDSAREKPMHGTVIAAGPGKINDEGGRTELTVSVGDTVIYGKYTGTEIEFDGETVVVLRESDLLAKLEG